MEHDEIITMLEDIGTCFGGRNFKEVKGNVSSSDLFFFDNLYN